MGRFFAPVVVAERYTGPDGVARPTLLTRRSRSGAARLDELALLYAVEVTADVVGLTNSSVPRMARRLVSFFNQPPFDLTRPDFGRTPRQWARAAVNGLVPIVRFYLSDVRPAIGPAGGSPRQDVISHLIGEGYTDLDILVECVTYGTAGMVTTREFICMAAWHLLRHRSLRERYLVAGQAERFAILNEFIRLEPVVGSPVPPGPGPFEVTDGDETWTIPPGHLVDLCIRPANADAEAVGASARPVPGAEPALRRQSGGAELRRRCAQVPRPTVGHPETDVLLTRLLAWTPGSSPNPRWAGTT